MKYIGSGFWAIAAAYLEVNGSAAAVVFMAIGILVAIWGGNKSLVTISNNFNQGGE